VKYKGNFIALIWITLRLELKYEFDRSCITSPSQL
jgi:hypothetical protein